jgi:hypothetical protein
MNFHWFIHEGYKETDALMVELIHDINLYIKRTDKEKDARRIEESFLEAIKALNDHIITHGHIFKTTSHVIMCLEEVTRTFKGTAETRKEKNALMRSLDAQRELLNQVNKGVVAFRDARINLDEMFESFKAREQIDRARVALLCKQLQTAVGVKYRNQ